MSASARPNFWSKNLSVVIGVGAFVFFLLTLSHWVSLLSLAHVSRVSGWLWRPQLEQPLTTAIFYPFSFLPKTWIPVALNIFTAGCASLVLTFLARSVAILPHDLTPNTPFAKDPPPSVLTIPTAWIPPLLASILCGLQLSFWEHATSASGEMIDLLAFAYIIKCLLEFRLDQLEVRLLRAALVYGAGMANNWALIGFFPIFLVALIRAKGYNAFREPRCLRRIIPWGLAGLSIFLLLPLVHAISPHSQVGFWSALKAHLKSQMESLGYLGRSRFRILAVASLLPVVVLSIRWKSHTVQFGDDTRLGNFLTKTTVHLAHGLFFLISFWIALDPTFSPRNLDLGTPMLTYYYLSAMVFGYCAGYFLLFGSRPVEQSTDNFASPRLKRFKEQLDGALVRLVPVTGMIFVLGIPVLLLGRNFGQIHLSNGHLLRQFTRDVYSDLPVGKSVVLSDDPVEFLLMKSEATLNAGQKEPLLIDAPSLNADQYHAFMARKFTRWPSSNMTKPRGSPSNVLKLISDFASREPVVYLYPAFGPLFEMYKAEPQGAVSLLKLRSEYDTASDSRRSIPDPPVSPWNGRWTGHLKKLSTTTKEGPGYVARPTGFLFQKLYLAPEPNRTVVFLGAAYSKRLDHWAVQLQRLGHDSEAQTWFRRALELNPGNLPAQINLNYAERNPVEKSELTTAAIQKRFPDLFARFPNWPEILKANGPVDEPNFLFRTGRILLDRGNNLQAIDSFVRCLQLAPDWPIANIWLAEAYLRCRDFHRVRSMTEKLQAGGLLHDGATLAQLLHCHVAALRNLGSTNEASAFLEAFITQNGSHNEVLSVAAELYAGAGQFDKELQFLDELVKREPTHPDLLARKGLSQLELSEFESAVITLTAALNIVPKNEYARLYRAVAYLGLGRLEDARADYQELLASSSSPRNALFGLGTVAWRQSQTNLAINYYKQFLSTRAGSTPETRQDFLAKTRLSDLQSRN